MMTHNRPLIVFLLLLVAAGALMFRVPKLAERPVHGDEAVHFEKFRILWQDHTYVYDPHEYHGPTHYYATFPVLWFTQPANFADTDEFTYRIVPVAFGVLLILLLPLIADGIGWWAILAAAVLTAISPAMVFYSRYYIQEIPLVVFTLLAMGGAWRYLRSGNLLWAIIAGLGVGLMHSTKETWVIAAFCMAVALVGTMVWTVLVDGRGTVTLGRKDLLGGVLALFVASGVAFVILSGMYSNPRGPWDSILTYTTYLDRGTGNTDHVNPWDFYLRILLFWRYGDNTALLWNPLQSVLSAVGMAEAPRRPAPAFSEAFIAVLAVVGAIAALWRAPRPAPAPLADQQGDEAPSPAGAALSPNPKFLGRFLVFYTLLMTVIYSFVPYKTPWCMLGFLHGMILLAGIGIVAIIRTVPTLPVKIIAAILILAGAGHLGWQSYQLNFGTDRNGTPLSASHFNPHVYGHPSKKVYEMLRRIRALDEMMPEGKKLQIRVATLDAWPLPWYLRDMEKQIGYWPDAASIPDALMDADVFITTPQIQDSLNGRLKGEYESEYYGLRKGVPLALYVRKPLWDQLIQTPR